MPCPHGVAVEATIVKNDETKTVHAVFRVCAVCSPIAQHLLEEAYRSIEPPRERAAEKGVK